MWIAPATRFPQIPFDSRSAAHDVEKQRRIVRDFIVQNYNATLVSPKESLALAGACKEAMAQNIKVIVLDRELGSDDYTCFVGGDNLQIGEAAGRQIAGLLPHGGTIAELQGLITSTPSQEPHQAFMKPLALFPP